MKLLEKKDTELDDLIEKRIALDPQKLSVVGTGITSSHLGDERNIREFLIANAVVKKMRDEGRNVLFYLFDDSYDPLNFRQLRVAVKKDEKLIAAFEKYCGMPIKLIPDPYQCHPNYSAHFQDEILDRFHSLDIYPNIIDSYNSYESGMYDFAKKIVFTKHKEIRDFLKKQFPKYTMKKLFCPLCPKCLKMDGVDLKRVQEGRATVVCSNCAHSFRDSWKNIRGKFSWKIDAAIKWNVFKVDFEPYSKAYLDPDVGSYFIAKKLSEKFFGGYVPEIVHYGQIIMDKSLSYKILSSFPKEAIHPLFVDNRKKDMVLNEKKLVEFSRAYLIDDNQSFYDYIVSRLPYDIFEVLQGNSIHPTRKKIMDYGIAFAKSFLNRELAPKLPDKELLQKMSKPTVLKIRRLFQWLILYKMEAAQFTQQDLSKELNTYLITNKLNKSALFPLIRKLLSQEESIPMSKIFYYAPLTYLYGCLLVLTKELADKKNRNDNNYSKKAHTLTVH